MCVPDLNLICEIMLMAEGFQQSKVLSRKFVILYKLCEDLLSKSRHYDWKLRTIKTTLYVAGSMKRQAPELSEDKVLSLGPSHQCCGPIVAASELSCAAQTPMHMRLLPHEQRSYRDRQEAA